mmetsp:Transcript_23797/g.68691  ORF Transcript_23797/g.68691 Transcript_23797/m.68691 type:complete len:141 (-) Transcript_23797:494-916(-)
MAKLTLCAVAPDGDTGAGTDVTFNATPEDGGVGNANRAGGDDIAAGAATKGTGAGNIGGVEAMTMLLLLFAAGRLATSAWVGMAEIDTFEAGGVGRAATACRGWIFSAPVPGMLGARTGGDVVPRSLAGATRGTDPKVQA